MDDGAAVVRVKATHSPPSPVATVVIAPTTTPTPPPAVPTTTTVDMTGAVAFLVSDRTELASMESDLGEVSGDYRIADTAVEAPQVIADMPLPDSRRFVLARWVAVTDQRRDVLGLSRGQVLDILRGEARDWSEFGGDPQPISAYLPVTEAVGISKAFGIPMNELAAELLPDYEVASRLVDTAGAFALMAPEELHVGMLALTVDGYDPYRDPARWSPLKLVRWIRASSADEAAELAAIVGLETAPPFDPVGMLVTGELIPVRCTNAALANLGDYGAMFDGVRYAMTDADIAVVPLESSLTDLGKPTPCVSTFVLQGSPRVVEALSEVGTDVVLTIGNHMLDCWGRCSGTGALLDTLVRLENAGIVVAGAGEDLSAARTPAVVGVETENGPVRFAFLGYDSIAPWNAAAEQTPGTAPLDAQNVREDVRAAADVTHHVVVGASWGVEYTSDPTALQREIGGIAVEAGAAVVVGNHPHWVQAVEHLDGGLVAYSLGNFVFDQDWSVETTQGMVLELGFTADRLVGYRIRPVVIRGDGGGLRWIYRPEFVDPAGEGRPILERIWEAQDRLPKR